MPSLVIIPTYNERENIASIVRAVLEQSDDFHVLVVDDSSPDGTAQVVESLQKEYPQRLYLLCRSGKLGLGTAYLAGFRWGLERDYQFFFEMDADFSHNPADLERLLWACQNGADVAIGSRYVRHGGLRDWPWDRILLSRGASLYARLILWMPVADPTAGFICYRRKVLEAIDLDKIRFVGYAFQIAMKYAAYSLGFVLREVPIIFKDREKGQSKMSLRIVREAMLGVWQMRWMDYGYSRQKKTSR